MSVRVSVESRRGCGYRKPGGLYLVAPGEGQTCGLLPIPLTVCPTCGSGFRHARGWSWVNPAKLAALAGHACTRVDGCGVCPLADSKVERAGMIWVGASFYKSTQMFNDEARRLGISRRIHTLPRGFKLGETWVALAHIYAIYSESNFELSPDDPENRKPGIFSLFRPSAVEYVVRGGETDDELDKLRKRGIEPMRVEHAQEQEAA